MQLFVGISKMHHISRTVVCRTLMGSCKTFQKNALPTLTLFTKDDCTLCDEAVDVLRPHLHKVLFEKVDITEEGNEAQYKKYRFDIPVFHLNGRFLMKHRADADLLLKALKTIQEKT